MSTTHACAGYPTSSAWDAVASPAYPTRHRVEGVSEEDFALLLLAFPPAGQREASTAAMGRYRLGNAGAISWVPPGHACGYHEPLGISVDIDADSGGGFVTFRALPEALAAGEVLPRLIRRCQAFLTPGIAVESVDIHAFRFGDAAPRTWPVFRPGCAFATLALAPSESRHPARISRAGKRIDALCWSGRGSMPGPADSLIGADHNLLLLIFRC